MRLCPCELPREWGRKNCGVWGHGVAAASRCHPALQGLGSWHWGQEDVGFGDTRGPGTGDSGVLVLGTVGCWRWGHLDHWQWGYWTVGTGDTRVLALGTVECWYRGTWVLALVTLGSWH